MKDNANNPLIRIAIDLGELYNQRAEARILNRKFTEQEEKRIANITPPEGWQGKNETERKAAMLSALVADEPLIQIRQRLSDIQDDLERTTAMIHRLDEEKEALQWTIRDMYLTQPVLSDLSSAFLVPAVGVPVPDAPKVEPKVE